MASIAQISKNEQSEITGTLKKFFADYKIRDLLKACRAEKQKGHSAICCASSSVTGACICRS